MKTAFLFLIFCVGESTLSTITSSPGLKRRHIAESCEFQWTVNGQLTSYLIQNKSTGTPSALSDSHSNHSLLHTTPTTSLIRLFIWNINLYDAGNYSLSVTQGTTTTIDAGALLFVYSSAGTSYVSNNGSLSATEGQSIALTCVVSTKSRPSSPASLLPPVHYFWRLGSSDTLGNISSGHPRRSNGEILTRYNVTNGGRTLVITSLQSSDRQVFSCWGQEEGSRYKTTVTSALSLTVNCRPTIVTRQPKSGKFNADVGQKVTFSVQFAASPAVVSAPTWTLINFAGISPTLPPQFQSLNLSNPFVVSFNLSSTAYYGHYTFYVRNTIGITSGSFSVLRPGVPDAPSHLTVIYKTFRLISVEWNCQWYNGRRQTTTLRLTDLETNEILDTVNRTETSDVCYNDTRIHLFQTNLRPDRDYDISLWSTNSLGSSDVVRSTVRTTKRFQLLVSPKTISINGSEARINFETMHGNMAGLNVTCCAEETGDCIAIKTNVDASTTHVVMSGIPTPGSVYLFDFVAEGEPAKGRRRYYLGMIKGVKVHRDGSPMDPLLIAVIVLGVLLAVASVSLVGCLVVFVYYRLRRCREAHGKSEEHKEGQKMTSELNELKPRKTGGKEQKATKEQQKIEKRPLPDLKFLRKGQNPPPKIPSPDEEDAAQETYEVVDREDEDGQMYTPLDQQPPPPSRSKKRNHYS